MLKSFKAAVEVVDEAEGIVKAAFSTFGVIDYGGDVTAKSSFKEGQKVIMSAYGHQSWKGALPYGHGTITTTDDQAIFTGQFLMKTDQGRNAFHTVDALGKEDLQEWSYSLRNVVAHKGSLGGRVANFLDSFDVNEVSPVLKGESIGTSTLETKSEKQLASMVSRMLCDAGCARWEGDGSYVSLDDFDMDLEFAVFRISNWSLGERHYVQVDFTRTDTSVELSEEEQEVEYTTSYLPKAMKFLDHSNLVMRQVDVLIQRAAEVVTLRAEKGKTISDESRDQIMMLSQRLEELVTATKTQNDPDKDEVQRLWLHSIRSQLQGAN